MEQRILTFLNQAQYKLGELGYQMINKSSRSIRMNEKDYILMQDLSFYIDYLYESVIPILNDSASDFNFVTKTEQEVLKQIELYEIRAELNFVPVLNMVKNITILQGDSTTSGGGSSSSLPEGAETGYYLTGNASGVEVWKQFDIFKSNFNDI